ncbi:MAG: ABC transporter permease [Anaerolineaceae bacterium]|nr:ABC transporter permease [Anaerolineaceae bacterium]
MKRRQILFASVGLLLFWQILSWLINQPILPAPAIVLREFFIELPGELGLHFLYSFYRVLASMLLSITLAVPAGLVLGQSKTLDRIFSPIIYLLYPIPKVVLIPIILLLFGINDISKILIIFLILFFQILVLVRDQAASIRPELVYSVQSLGAGRRALFLFVYFPASLPAVLTAIRQSIGTAVAVLYIVELFATQYGLGYYIYKYGNTLFNYPRMYAGVLTMSLLGLMLYFSADLLHKKLCPWQFAENGDIKN